MYKPCLLLTCLACSSDGGRLQGMSAQHFSSRDVEGQKLRGHMNFSTESLSHGQGRQLGSGQLPKNMANRNKVLPTLLTLFGPAAVFAPRPAVHVSVSVEWDGLDLRNENLRAIESFHEAHPRVPLTHFMSAAYFLNSDSMHEWNPAEVVRPIDDIGLHVLGLKSLVETSGVEYRSGLNMLQDPKELKESLDYAEYLRVLAAKKSKWKKVSEGSGIPNHPGRGGANDTDIGTYTVGELQTIISNAKAILEKHFFKVGKTFRAGPRLAGPVFFNLLEAMRREQFLVSSSAVGLDKIINKHVRKRASEEKVHRRDRPLSVMLRERWPGITKEAQPFLRETLEGGWILEMPDTGLMANHTSVDDMVAHIDRSVRRLDSQDRFVHIGFRQETASMTIESVIAAITESKRKHGRQLVFETVMASAKHVTEQGLTKAAEAYRKAKPKGSMGSSARLDIT